MAANFRPGGFEDDYDDFDDDGFCFGAVGDDFSDAQRVSHPTMNNNDTGTSFPRGGFGKPPPQKKQEPTTNYKRSSDLRNEQNAKPLDNGDFQMAVVRGNIDRVKHYIKSGFHIDTELRSGWTGLMYAANHANTEMVELLLKSGANPNFHKDMYTVLMAACGAGGFKEDDVENVIRILLGKGAKANTYDRYHTSPLMYAAREGHSEVLEMLVEAGANVNKQDNRGFTALTWAVSKKRKECVRRLIKLKANPRLKHSNGRTVIDMAETDNNFELLEILEGKKRDNIYNEPTTVQPTPSSVVPSTSRDTYGTTYGDLELFLCGLELSHLVDVVRNQHIDFNTFLRMTDEDLIKMGIPQLGVRKKILDGILSVHKKEWEKSSLPQIQDKKHIGCAEALAVLANVLKHTKYINTTIGFLQDQINSKPAILDELQGGIGPKQLHQHTVDTLHNISTLESQISSLKEHLEKVLKTGNFDPPDIVQTQKVKKISKTRSKLPIIVISTVSLILVVWNRTFLWNRLEKLVTKNL
ncbi:Ankyrin repeat [Mactra antiquata]